MVTLGMPAMFYRWVFRVHSLKALEDCALRLVGIAPIHESWWVRWKV